MGFFADSVYRVTGDRDLLNSVIVGVLLTLIVVIILVFLFVGRKVRVNGPVTPPQYHYREAAIPDDLPTMTPLSSAGFVTCGTLAGWKDLGDAIVCPYPTDATWACQSLCMAGFVDGRCLHEAQDANYQTCVRDGGRNPVAVDSAGVPYYLHRLVRA
jgi:hypothetical protein